MTTTTNALVTGYVPERIAKVFAIYLAHSEACMRETPENYAPKVLAAGARANADKAFAIVRDCGVRRPMLDNSPSWKRTCKTLGIRLTYKAIEAWLRGDDSQTT